MGIFPRGPSTVEIPTDVLHHVGLGDEEVRLAGQVFRLVVVIPELFELVTVEDVVGDLLGAEGGFALGEDDDVGLLAGAFRKNDALVDAVRWIVEVEIAQVDSKVHRLTEVPRWGLVECACHGLLYVLICHFPPP